MKNLLKIGLIIIAISSCAKKTNDPAPPVIDQELITDYYIQFTDTTVSPATVQLAKFVDPDGDGGLPATITGVNLMANKVYKISNLLYDKSKTPMDTTTNEIQEKNLEHRFEFTVESTLSTSPLQLTVFGLNLDDHGQTLGLKAIVRTGTASTGKLKSTLHHYDSAAEKTLGLTNAALGETDIEVEFPVTIY